MRIIGTGAGRGSEEAFSLVETIVGAMMVALLFVGLYAGMSGGFALTRVARENLRATQILLERMEGIRLYNWDQLTASNMIPTTFTNYYYPLVNGGESRGIPYVGRFTISNVNFPSPAPSYANDLRLVTVQIWWTNSLGTNQVVRTRQMQSLVGRLGIQNYVFNN
jgi:type II secretory pathway pseudopilin PulG